VLGKDSCKENGA